jgi:hypothetical protein
VAQRSRTACRASAIVLLAAVVIGCSSQTRPGSLPVGPSDVAAQTPSMAAVGAELPDLRMARLDDLQLDVDDDDGQRLLRFTATIVNVGAGPMEVRAAQDGDEIGPAVQRVYTVDGFDDRETDASFFWAGDGHEHWHVRDMQAYRVERLDGDGEAVSEKHGFCLFDNGVFDASLPGSPDDAAYECPNEEVATGSTIRMGLSVGWRDVYPATLPNQYIDVSELPEGRYRLWAEADPVTDGRPTGWFVESDESNNVTWVEFELTDEPGDLRVLDHGGAASPEG